MLNEAFLRSGGWSEPPQKKCPYDTANKVES